MLARSLVARYGHHVQERVGAVYLDAKSRVIREREIYIGTLNSTTVSTRDIIRHAINDHAAALIVFHNHPSGDPSPSSEDLVFTKQLVDAGQLLSIEVLDHLILGINRYVSLKGMQAM
ncbi:MAG: JAB domain-containing protein [Thermoanaerobaculia bacterium]